MSPSGARRLWPRLAGPSGEAFVPQTHARGEERSTSPTLWVVLRGAGRSPTGRSRTHVGHRACSRACTPHARQNAFDAVVLTSCSNPPSWRDTASRHHDS